MSSARAIWGTRASAGCPGTSSTCSEVVVVVLGGESGELRFCNPTEQHATWDPSKGPFLSFYEERSREGEQAQACCKRAAPRVV